jgi:DNA-binding GntR family transcriptional regulator
MLFHNELVPNHKIAYRDLAIRLGMSVTPVIHALKWLEFQGLARHEPNRGYYIAPFSLEEVSETYDLRQTIEVSLLTQSVKNLNEPRKKKLKCALKAHLSAARETYLNERLLKDMEFHLTLASFAERPIHLQVLRNLFDLLYLKYRGSDLSARSMDVVDQEHRDIYEAVVSGDVAKSRRILSHHLAQVKKNVLGRLKRIMEDNENFPF